MNIASGDKVLKRSKFAVLFALVDYRLDCGMSHALDGDKPYSDAIIFDRKELFALVYVGR